MKQKVKKYYLHEGTTLRGPYKLEDLETIQVTEETCVWYEGMTQWIMATDMEELQHLFREHHSENPGDPKRRFVTKRFKWMRNFSGWTKHLLSWRRFFRWGRAVNDFRFEEQNKGFFS